MARKKKSFEEKQKDYLKKNKVTLPEEPHTFILQKRKQDEALEMLIKAGFRAGFKDFILYCECADNEEYQKYENFLLKHFGKDGKVAFSYGASIKNFNNEKALEYEKE